ncbi:hypothetical protein PWT90_11219 [Aphanocladium album]|nr:hypothetical protein PWT90_11219 [Aphanocladium album]
MTTGVVVQEELGREFPALASLDPASKELRSDASPWHLTLKGMESEPCAFAEWPLGSLSASESLMTQLGDEVDPRYVFLGEQGTAFVPFHATGLQEGATEPWDGPTRLVTSGCAVVPLDGCDCVWNAACVGGSAVARTSDGCRSVLTVFCGGWWGCHRGLLDVSEWQWSVGEKIQALEYRWYTDLDVGTRLICTDENCALEAGWL